VTTLLSLLYGGYFFLTAAILMLVSVLIFPLVLVVDKRRRCLHYLASLWGYHFVATNPGWQCHFEGMENYDRNGTYVVVANHQSIADIFILSGLNRPFKWVSKASVFKVPFFGWNMFFTGYVPIERGDLSSIKKMILRCKNWLCQGESILMFPEGTRSDDGTIGKFRDGSFKLAAETGVCVLPIVIDGTREILPKHVRKLGFAADVHVRVLEPIKPSSVGSDAHRLRDKVRMVMKTAVDEMRLAHADR
jgi:1-acyl-sn-glycerol-3-phosphate acyltransferase